VKLPHREGPQYRPFNRSLHRRRSGQMLIQEITMKSITNLRVVQSATAAMAGLSLSMIVYVVGHMFMG